MCSVQNVHSGSKCVRNEVFEVFTVLRSEFAVARSVFEVEVVTRRFTVGLQWFEVVYSSWK